MTTLAKIWFLKVTLSAKVLFNLDISIYILRTNLCIYVSINELRFDLLSDKTI